MAKKRTAPAPARAKRLATDAKKPAAKKRAATPAPARRQGPPDERARLRGQIAKELGIAPAAVELRALRDLAASLGLGAKAAPKPAAVPAATGAASASRPAAGASYLPQRLYLALDGRGLDGRGMPFEVIDLPCIIGSSKRANVWINSPRIETNHLRITQDDAGWLVEDLGSEHGTFLGEERVDRRVLQDGDELKLAGYLRLRAELR